MDVEAENSNTPLESGEDPVVHRLYTPAMLARLLEISVAKIRRWHRRGLLVPAKIVRRLPYFDFQEIAAAKKLNELETAGIKPAQIERRLGQLAEEFPHIARPLAELTLVVAGRDVLYRLGDRLVGPRGQMRFDFDRAPPMEAASPAGSPPDFPSILRLPSRGGLSGSESADVHVVPSELVRGAEVAEEEGRLNDAVDLYRAALAAVGPQAEWCFGLAELLYRLGDLSGARERYFMAIELDEDFVEARANLGCVLAETGERELAASAFEGALAFHPDYADVHFHLAGVFDELGRTDRATVHWRRFLQLAPESPWADAARERLSAIHSAPPPERPD